jgi:exodeoxyribonuclease-5
MNLSTTQQQIFDDLLAFILQPTSKHYSILEGYAGTGKSYLITSLVDFCLKNHSSIEFGITAPTHKAVKVLRQNSINADKLYYGTIHSFLGLRQKVNDHSGVVTYEPEKNQSSCKVDAVDVLLVDEVSMLDTALFKHILAYKEKRDKNVGNTTSCYGKNGQTFLRKVEPLRLIFIGDPLQIPPVGKAKSFVFDPASKKEYDFDVHTLRDPMRQAKENPILGFATYLRSNISSSVMPFTDFLGTSVDGQTGIDLINLDQFKQEVLPMFGQPFDDNQDFIKVVTWRNETARKYNNIIRAYRLNMVAPPKIVPGDYLVADKPIVEMTDMLRPVIYKTSEEFKVLRSEVIEYKVNWLVFKSSTELASEIDDPFAEYSTQRSHVFKAYKCICKSEEDSQTRTIYIIHEDSEEYYNQVVSALATTAKKAYMKSKAWVAYYQFQDWFANVKHNYAITAHKSQGSTYANCVTVYTDMEVNSNVVERNKIKYVSVTRAKNKLFLI